MLTQTSLCALFTHECDLMHLNDLSGGALILYRTYSVQIKLMALCSYYAPLMLKLLITWIFDWSLRED